MLFLGLNINGGEREEQSGGVKRGGHQSGAGQVGAKKRRQRLAAPAKHSLRSTSTMCRYQ